MKQKFWKCGVCKKEFARPNQSHKCEIVPLETLFKDKAPVLFEVYKTLLERLSVVCSPIVTTSSKAITLYAPNRKAFMAMEIKRAWIDLWFYLDYHPDEFPIFKTIKSTKDKYAHFIRLQKKEDVDRQLINWLKEAYGYILRS